MEISIQLQTTDPALKADLFGTSTIRRGDRITLTDGVALIFERADVEKDIGAGEIILFLLSIPTGVATSIAGNYLFQKLQARSVTRLTIGTKSIPINGEDIQDALKEESRRTSK